MSGYLRGVLKDLFFTIARPFFAGLGDRACILMYHSVSDNDLFFNTRLGDFDRQMRYIKKHYNVVPLQKLCRRIKDKESIAGLVSITIDDGYEDEYTNVLPVLKKYDLHATIFLIPGLLGKRATFLTGARDLPLLTGVQVREMVQSGHVDFMPHTMTHPNLDELPLDRALDEIEESRKQVEELTGKPATIFAYPRGRYTKEIVDHLRAAWEAAVSTKTGLVSTTDDAYLLRRIPVDSKTTMTQFKGKLSRAIDWYEAMKV